MGNGSDWTKKKIQNKLWMHFVKIYGPVRFVAIETSREWQSRRMYWYEGMLEKHGGAIVTGKHHMFATCLNLNSPLNSELWIGNQLPNKFDEYRQISNLNRGSLGARIMNYLILFSKLGNIH
jgi:hypothetical protein